MEHVSVWLEACLVLSTPGVCGVFRGGEHQNSAPIAPGESKGGGEIAGRLCLCRILRQREASRQGTEAFARTRWLGFAICCSLFMDSTGERCVCNGHHA